MRGRAGGAGDLVGADHRAEGADAGLAARADPGAAPSAQRRRAEIGMFALGPADADRIFDACRADGLGGRDRAARISSSGETWFIPRDHLLGRGGARAERGWAGCAWAAPARQGEKGEDEEGEYA